MKRVTKKELQERLELCNKELMQQQLMVGIIVLIVRESSYWDGKKHPKLTSVGNFEEFDNFINRHPGDLDLKCAIERLRIARNKELDKNLASPLSGSRNSEPLQQGGAFKSPCHR